MGHLGMVEVRFSQLRRVGRWHPSHLKFDMLRPEWRWGTSRNRSGAIDLLGQPSSAGSQLASSREKTKDQALIPAKNFLPARLRRARRFSPLLHFFPWRVTPARPVAGKILGARRDPSMGREPVTS